MRWPKDWGTRTAVMGVINVTPDSFSDGGQFNQLDRALAEASRQIASGADCLDLGAQSTRPNALEVGADEELMRLLPALRAIRAAHPKVLISVDTFLAGVAKNALEAGADWINDVSGGRRDSGMLSLIADAGLKSDQLLWDPGLGFAKTTAQNLTLLKQLDTLVAEGIPLLLGPSRKRFIGAVLDEPRARARLWGTAAVCARAVDAGVAVLRVHDVGPIHQVVTMASAIASDR